MTPWTVPPPMSTLSFASTLAGPSLMSVPTERVMVLVAELAAKANSRVPLVKEMTLYMEYQ